MDVKTQPTKQAEYPEKAKIVQIMEKTIEALSEPERVVAKRVWDTSLEAQRAVLNDVSVLGISGRTKREGQQIDIARFSQFNRIRLLAANHENPNVRRATAINPFIDSLGIPPLLRDKNPDVLVAAIKAAKLISKANRPSLQ